MAAKVLKDQAFTDSIVTNDPGRSLQAQPKSNLNITTTMDRDTTHYSVLDPVADRDLAMSIIISVCAVLTISALEYLCTLNVSEYYSVIVIILDCLPLVLSTICIGFLLWNIFFLRILKPRLLQKELAMLANIRMEYERDVVTLAGTKANYDLCVAQGRAMLQDLAHAQKEVEDSRIKLQIDKAKTKKTRTRLLNNRDQIVRGVEGALRLQKLIDLEHYWGSRIDYCTQTIVASVIGAYTAATGRVPSPPNKSLFLKYGEPDLRRDLGLLAEPYVRYLKSPQSTKKASGNRDIIACRAVIEDLAASVPKAEFLSPTSTVNDNAQHDVNKQSNSPTELFGDFCLFPRLPIELRLSIWQLAAEEGRVIEVRECIGAWMPCLKAENPTPSLLHVCREARAEGMKRYRLIVADSSISERGIWDYYALARNERIKRTPPFRAYMNFSCDTLLLSESHVNDVQILWHLLELASFGNENTTIIAEHLRHLAVGPQALQSFLLYEKRFGSFSNNGLYWTSHFDALQTISFIPFDNCCGLLLREHAAISQLLDVDGDYENARSNLQKIFDAAWGRYQRTRVGEGKSKCSVPRLSFAVADRGERSVITQNQEMVNLLECFPALKD
ncbi:hypothetical protein B0O99DRAFT_689228 [Bisporella sp. PMI_857]|nr:hypothetical protein B0O99DRAFT_689228 [Bisporella sp. PMI_857]